MLNKIGILVMVVGVIGFALTFLGMVQGVSLQIWGGAAIVGTVITIFTGRPGD